MESIIINPQVGDSNMDGFLVDSTELSFPLMELNIHTRLYAAIGSVASSVRKDILKRDLSNQMNVGDFCKTTVGDVTVFSVPVSASLTKEDADSIASSLSLTGVPKGSPLVWLLGMEDVPGALQLKSSIESHFTLHEHELDSLKQLVSKGAA